MRGSGVVSWQGVFAWGLMKATLAVSQVAVGADTPGSTLCEQGGRASAIERARSTVGARRVTVSDRSRQEAAGAQGSGHRSYLRLPTDGRLRELLSLQR